MKRKTIAIACIAVLIMTGCGGTFPELSREEESAIGEYAANMLLRYDANSRSRLVDLSQISEVEEVPVSKPESEDLPEQSKPEEQDVAEPSEEVGISDAENSCSSMEEFLELPEGVGVSYVGYDVVESYQESDNQYFVLEAAEGKKLLVLRFALQNDSAGEQEINLLMRQDNYRVTVNENYTRTALTTMLSNDMSTYMGNMVAGETRELVVLIEVENTMVENMESISINLKNESKTYTIQLL